jgi:hypothetical protein
VRGVTTFCRPAVTRPRRIPVRSVGRVDESRITRREGRQGDGDPGLARSAHEFRDAKPEPGQGPIEELAGRPACPRRLAAAIGCHPGDNATRPLFEFFVEPLDLALSYRYTYRSNAVVDPSFASPARRVAGTSRIRGISWSFLPSGGKRGQPSAQGVPPDEPPPRCCDPARAGTRSVAGVPARRKGRRIRSTPGP